MELQPRQEIYQNRQIRGNLEIAPNVARILPVLNQQLLGKPWYIAMKTV